MIRDMLDRAASGPADLLRTWLTRHLKRDDFLQRVHESFFSGTDPDLWENEVSVACPYALSCGCCARSMRHVVRTLHAHA